MKNLRGMPVCILALALCFFFAVTQVQSEEIYTKPFGSAAPNESPIYRAFEKGLKVDKSPFIVDIKGRTSYSLFKTGMSKGAASRGLFDTLDDKLQHHAISWDTIDRRIREFGSGLLNTGVPETSFSDEAKQGGKFRFVGILSVNNPEYFISLFACAAYGLTAVPIHCTFHDEPLTGLLNDSQVTTMLIGSRFLSKLTLIKPKIPTLKSIIVIDHSMAPASEIKAAEKAGLTVTAMSSVESAGASKMITPASVPSQNIAQVIYTSGTSGTPKGVMLTHENLVAAVEGYSVRPNKLLLNAQFRHMSYLPLSHVFEQFVATILISKGAHVGIYRGIREKLAEDFKAHDPTAVIMVPAIAKKFFDAVLTKIADKMVVMRKMINKCFASSTKAAQKNHLTGRVVHPMKRNKMCAAITKKIRHAAFGPSLKFIIMGGGATSPELQIGLRAALGVPVIIGWGMTEGAGADSWQVPEDNTINTMGGISPVLEFKLKSWESYKANVKPTNKQFPEYVYPPPSKTHQLNCKVSKFINFVHPSVHYLNAANLGTTCPYSRKITRVSVLLIYTTIPYGIC
eukprot:GHVT01063526.1.p1 GENE.GHVT01063526.1~~GHVT01063526.1.p1  ORF type:complete len:569 (+),score=43.01 GHVT01063526.1:147-1853(+)